MRSKVGARCMQGKNGDGHHRLVFCVTIYKQTVSQHNEAERRIQRQPTHARRVQEQAVTTHTQTGTHLLVTHTNTHTKTGTHWHTQHIQPCPGDMHGGTCTGGHARGDMH